MYCNLEKEATIFEHFRKKRSPRRAGAQYSDYNVADYEAQNNDNTEAIFLTHALNLRIFD
jgi:hypothetical protein